ncbi:hypothetical protein HN011_005456 [Eciton burchellii]|nr:hypothetical protein HN011_005456 [Eciton burchellii]
MTKKLNGFCKRATVNAANGCSNFQLRVTIERKAVNRLRNVRWKEHVTEINLFGLKTSDMKRGDGDRQPETRVLGGSNLEETEARTATISSAKSRYSISEL